MEDATKELAKAAQEVAKAARVGIEATERLGHFTADLIREPAESIVGILTDRLRYMRWERQVRLLDRAQALIRERHLEGVLVPVSPKLAIPILERATLEEDDSLQDIWVRLLLAAADPAIRSRVRVAFIEVISNLEPIDAALLALVHDRVREHVARHVQVMGPEMSPRFHEYSVSDYDITRALQIPTHEYTVAVDNLMRLRLLAGHVSHDKIPIEVDAYRVRTKWVPVIHGYDSVVMTSFGWDFTEVCAIEEATAR